MLVKGVYMSNLGRILLWLGVGILLLVLPPTRMLIWYILPFGSGWDDILFIILIIAYFSFSGVGLINGVFWSKVKVFWQKLKE